MAQKDTHNIACNDSHHITVDEFCAAHPAGMRTQRDVLQLWQKKVWDTWAWECLEERKAHAMVSILRVVSPRHILLPDHGKFAR